MAPYPRLWSVVRKKLPTPAVAPVDMLAVEVAKIQTGCGNVGMAVGVSREDGGL